jgi:hypothetical protein
MCVCVKLTLLVLAGDVRINVMWVRVGCAMPPPSGAASDHFARRTEK